MDLAEGIEELRGRSVAVDIWRNPWHLSVSDLSRGGRFLPGEDMEEIA